jgi:DNA-binding beta-propeller fold protein YncE
VRIAWSSLLSVLVAIAVAMTSGTAIASPAGGGCSTAIATGPALSSANPTFTHVGGSPFGVATTRGYAFVANLSGVLDVLADRDSAPHLIHRIPLPGGQGVGVDMTADGRYLLLADGRGGAIVVDVARAESGAKDAVLGTLAAQSKSQIGGAIEVTTSRDGRYAFVSLEDTREIAVYRLAAAIADHFTKPSYVGAIPTGIAPVGLAVSPDGRWLYSTSEINSATRGQILGRDGSLSVISVATAEHEPDHAVVATVSAGCSPVRVTVSANGQDVWVTARESDELLAFSASKLAGHASDPELADVRVGEAPVGLALVDSGKQVVVADSNRFTANGQHSSLTVVSTVEALAHKDAIVGTVAAGAFPREMALEPAGTVLLVGNFGSGTLESVNVADLG